MDSFSRKLLKVKTFVEIKKPESPPKKDLSKGVRPPWIDKLIRSIEGNAKPLKGPDNF